GRDEDGAIQSLEVSQVAGGGAGGNSHEIAVLDVKEPPRSTKADECAWHGLSPRRKNPCKPCGWYPRRYHTTPVAHRPRAGAPRREVRELQALVRRRADLRQLAAHEKARLDSPLLTPVAR